MTESVRTIVCHNASLSTGAFALLRSGIASTIGQPWPVVWMAERVPPGGRVRFRWCGQTPGFAWARTGRLVPGSDFFATETIAAEPPGFGRIDLVAHDGTARFQGLHGTGCLEELHIRCTAQLPQGSLSVAACLDGRPVAAVQALPNVLIGLTTGTSWRLAFGNLEAGAVVDPSHLATGIELPAVRPGQTVSATLNLDMLWKLSSG